jgi:type IV pilus assembly protein PilB
LNKTSTNILTVEDPIEYTLEGINQVQLNEAIGLDYSTALRSFLRQDPDIIMLGEIRDAETAQMAIRSALTGHLVFSTIHTNSAWGTVSRLIDMGVPAYLLANTLLLSLAQRLLRLLCPHCKQPIELTRNMLPHSFTIPKDLQTVYKPVGCKHCYYTGYKGRKAIYEVIPVDKEISYAIKQNELDIDTYIQTHNIIQLKDMALEMLRMGETSTDEVFPVLLHEF